MNQNYLNGLTPYPNQQNVVLANPGTNVTLDPNYFHHNNQQFRMGDDFLTLSNSQTWYPFHVTEGKIIYPSIETFVGITEDELQRVENREDEGSITIEVDLLRCNQHSQMPTEIFLPNGNELEINGNIYSVKIDYNSGNFHNSSIPIGIIGERFNIEIF